MKKYGVKAYDAQIENSARLDSSTIDGLSEYIVKIANEENIPIEEDVDTLTHQIRNDISKNIPPQIYSLISSMIDVIEQLEADNNEG